MATLGNLVVNLSANSQRLNKGLSNAQKRLKRFRKAAVTAIKGGVIAGVGGAVAGVAILKKQMGDLDKVAKLSGRTGFDSATIAGFGFAAEQSGSSVENANKSLDQFTRRMGDAADGSGASADALRKMGLSVGDLMSESPEQQLFAVADAIQSLPTAAEQADAAYQMFGRSGQELVNVLATGASGIQAFQNEANRLGLGFDNAELAKIEAANDAMNRISRAVGAVGSTVAIQLAPGIERFATGMLDAANQAGGVGSVVGSVVDFISDAWATMTDGLAVAVTASTGAAIVAFENIGDIAAITGQTIALAFVSGFETMKHFLTKVLPAATMWLWDNIGSLFTDGVNFATTVFSNMTENLKNAWTAFWQWIKGDGDFDFEWKGLTDGFIAKTSALPDVGERQITALEKSLEKGISASGDNLAKSWDRNVTQPLNTLAQMQAEAKLVQPDFAAKATKLPTIDDVVLDSPSQTTSSESSQQMAGIAQRGSTEAFSQIVSAMQRGPSPGEKLDKERNKDLKEIKENTRPQNDQTTLVVAEPV